MHTSICWDGNSDGVDSEPEMYVVFLYDRPRRNREECRKDNYKFLFSLKERIPISLLWNKAVNV